MKTAKRYFHSDSGHGWLAVKLLELHQLGLLNKISFYSYINGKTAYLEEDLDMGIYLQEIEKRGMSIEIISAGHKDRSQIRSYNTFSLTQAQVAL